MFGYNEYHLQRADFHELSTQTETSVYSEIIARDDLIGMYCKIISTCIFVIIRTNSFLNMCCLFSIASGRVWFTNCNVKEQHWNTWDFPNWYERETRRFASVKNRGIDNAMNNIFQAILIISDTLSMIYIINLIIRPS